MAGYDAEIRVRTAVDTSQMQRLEIQIQRATSRVAELTQRLDVMRNQRIPTTEYAQLEASLSSARAEMDRLVAEQGRMEELGISSGGAWNALNNQIANAEDNVQAIRAQMQALDEAGRAFTLGSGTDEFRRMSEDLQLAQAQLRMLNTRHGELAERENEIQAEQRDTTRGWKRLAEVGKKALNALISRTKSSGGMLQNLSSRLKSLAVGLLVFNQISKGFNAMVSSMKEGLKNLEGYSEEYGNTMDDFRNSCGVAKNALATAFAPILTHVLPYVTQLINTVTAASNALSRFFAILSGKTTYTKAIDKVSGSLEDVADSAKKAKGALAGFDELNVLQEEASGGTSGGGSGAGDIFEEVDIGKISDFTQKLKDAINAGDWYGVGALLGKKLNDALNNIDWDAIKGKARQIAANIANFLNGGLESTDWYLVGATVAEGLNTAFEFLHTFVTTFHWDSLGLSVAEGINGFFNTFDFVKAGLTLSKFALGVLEAVKTSLGDEGIEWGTIGEKIALFLNTIEWKEILVGLGETIGVAIVASIKFTKGFRENADDIVLNMVDAFVAAGIATKLGAALGLTIGQSFVGGLFGLALFKASPAANEPEFPEIKAPKREDYSSTTEYTKAIDAQKESIMNWCKEVDKSNDKTLFGEQRVRTEDGFNQWMVDLWNDIDKWWRETALVTWWQDTIMPYFTAEKWQELGQGIENGISAKWTEFATWWDGSVGEWWNTGVAPWFTLEKWLEVGQGIEDGISAKWTEFTTWWEGTALVTWWDESVAPWFTLEKWSEVGHGIMDGISAVWTELCEWWDGSIVEWWDNNVAPWFTAEKWKELGEGIKNGIYSGFKGVTKLIIDILNDLISSLENLLNFAVTGVNEWLSKIGETKLGEKMGLDFSIGAVKFDRIPYLANGAVIRGGNPFLAFLGDQPTGQTNIEAPLSTIQQALKNVMSEYGGGGAGSINLTLELDGREVYNRMIQLDRQMVMSTGESGFGT